MQREHLDQSMCTHCQAVFAPAPLDSWNTSVSERPRLKLGSLLQTADMQTSSVNVSCSEISWRFLPSINNYVLHLKELWQQIVAITVYSVTKNKRKKCLLEFLPLLYFTNNTRTHQSLHTWVRDWRGVLRGREENCRSWTLRWWWCRAKSFLWECLLWEEWVNQSTDVCRGKPHKVRNGRTHRGRGIWGEAHPPQ